MRSHLKRSILTVGLLLGAATAAHARGLSPEPWEWGPPPGQDNHHSPWRLGSPPYNAPEVDPSMLSGGLSLLAGTLMVMRARRSE